ncbi:MAG: hypothetical protein U0324_01310 [Polyangiales bacterium]
MRRPSIELNEDVATALEEAARARNADPEALANDALREWLLESAEIARKVEAGLAEVRAGRVVEHARVREWITSRGADAERPRPR